MAHELDAARDEMMGDVLQPPCAEIIGNDDLAAARHKPVGEVRAEETCTTCHQDAL